MATRKPKFSIELIQPEDTQKVVELVHQYFFKVKTHCIQSITLCNYIQLIYQDEPIAKSLGSYSFEDVSAYVTDILSSGLSLKAVNPETKKIIALSLSKGITRVNG